MSTSSITVTLHDAALEKEVTLIRPAAFTLGELRKQLLRGVKDTTHFTLVVGEDGCVPSGAVTLADLAMGSQTLDLQIHNGEEGKLGGCFDMCINPIVEGKQQEAADNYSYIAGQLVSQ